MAVECERKYIGVDFATVRDALRQNQAVCEGAHIESNTVWDDAARSLRPKGTLLRLRTQQWFGPLNAPHALDRIAHVLTLKTAASEHQGCKIREECEVSVDDVTTMESILMGLGYSITARYEKVREVWNLYNTELTLDILPFGRYMEVEGTIEDIEHVAHLVHIAAAPQSTLSYHRLHQEWREQQGLPPLVDFVFEAQRRAELVRYLQEMSL